MLNREELEHFKELCNFTRETTSSSPKSEIQRLGLHAVEDILKYRAALKDILFRLERISQYYSIVQGWELVNTDIQDVIHSIERILNVKDTRV